MPEVASRLKSYAALLTAIAALIASIGSFWKIFSESQQTLALQKAVYNVQQERSQTIEDRITQIEKELQVKPVESTKQMSGVSTRRITKLEDPPTVIPTMSFEEIRSKTRNTGIIEEGD